MLTDVLHPLRDAGISVELTDTGLKCRPAPSADLRSYVLANRSLIIATLIAQEQNYWRRYCLTKHFRELDWDRAAARMASQPTHAQACTGTRTNGDRTQRGQSRGQRSAK